MLRRFEFISGTSAKFWEIDLNATRVTVRFGRLGTAGQQQEKQFGSSSDAGKHAEKLIAEKLRKGYQETAGV